MAWLEIYNFFISAKIFAKKDLEENSTDFSLKEYLERKKCFIDAYNGIDVGIIGLTVIQIQHIYIPYKMQFAFHTG